MDGLIAVERQAEGDVVQEVAGITPGQFLSKAGVRYYEWTGLIWPAGVGPAISIGDFAAWKATKEAKGFVFRPMLPC